MKKHLAFMILIISVLLTVSASADDKDLYIDQNVQKIFTSEDGLMSTSTQAIAQTSEGFIWIGGYGGLVRYDGKHFHTFAYKRITRVSGLSAGENGTLWVATSDKGLFKYENHEFSSVSGSDEDAVLDIQCIASAPDGTLYLGTGTGMYTVTDDTISRLDIPLLNGEHIDKLVCPKDGLVLCITRQGTLFSYDGREARQIAPDKDYVFRSICMNAGDGTYMAGTSGNEVLLFDSNLEQIDLLIMHGLSCINDLHYDEHGVLWLCADNGIAIYVNRNIRMQHLLMDNSVDHMMVDQEGNDWFVSSRQGVLEVSRSKFGDISQSAGLDSIVTNAIARIGNTLYIGHDSGMAVISATDFKKNSTTPFDMLKGVRVRSLLTDSDGTLWIGTMKKGLFHYIPGKDLTGYTSKTHPELCSDNIRSITETDEGILIGTDKGAYLVNGGEVRNVASDPSQLSFRILSAVKIGDTFCLGSDGNGLYRVKDGEITSHITTDDGLSSNVIMKAYQSDRYGGIWLITGNDIDYIDENGGIKSISNFPSTNNLDLLIMKNGDAWVFTGSGIYQTTEESLLTDEEPVYQHFRRADGLPYEVTPNSYQCRTDDVIYVCGSGGVFSLQTDFTETKPGSYQIEIDSVMADNEPLYVTQDSDCTIEADTKRIDIKAYVLTYQTGNPYVFYYLEGFDDEPVVTRLSNLGDISYTNLNGGDYTFHFGIRDYQTGDVLQEITLPITKKHAWYENPVVKSASILLGLLLFVLITLLIIRVRSRRITRALQKEYEQKEREHLEEIAYNDYLTGLFNRNYLDVWNNSLPLPESYPVTFVSIDMNDLKKINDRFGHKEGDQLLCSMSGLLKKYFADERYTIFRTGGDEFLVLARQVDSEEVRGQLEKMAEEGSGMKINGIPVTFAYGLCTQRDGEFNFDEGLRVSDLEMLENKHQFHRSSIRD